MKRDAVISGCGQYRYTLTRDWREREGEQAHVCMFVMLNPSTADGKDDDPTIRRCVDFARRQGCNVLIVVNVFPFRCTNPKYLPVPTVESRERNMDAVRGVLATWNPELVICAWGKHKRAAWESRYVLNVLDQSPRAAGRTIVALQLNADGSPKHPLYVRADVTPVPFVKRDAFHDAGKVEHAALPGVELT